LTRITAAAFPELRRVFGGYLHEDYLVESGTPEAALRAFREDAAPAELRRFRREAKKLLAHAERLDFDEVRDLIEHLGGRWIPQSREALIALLREAAGINEPPAK
jgi:hypothetical protein